MIKLYVYQGIVSKYLLWFILNKCFTCIFYDPVHPVLSHKIIRQRDAVSGGVLEACSGGTASRAAQSRDI